MFRILTVDDTFAIRVLYDDILSEEGHEVHLESGPILDLDRVEQLAPDLSSWATCLDSNRLGWT